MVVGTLAAAVGVERRLRSVANNEELTLHRAADWANPIIAIALPDLPDHRFGFSPAVPEITTTTVSAQTTTWGRTSVRVTTLYVIETDRAHAGTSWRARKRRYRF